MIQSISPIGQRILSSMAYPLINILCIGSHPISSLIIPGARFALADTWKVIGNPIQNLRDFVINTDNRLAQDIYECVGGKMGDIEILKEF